MNGPSWDELFSCMDAIATIEAMSLKIDKPTAHRWHEVHCELVLHASVHPFPEQGCAVAVCRSNTRTGRCDSRVLFEGRGDTQAARIADLVRQMDEALGKAIAQASATSKGRVPDVYVMVRRDGYVPKKEDLN